MKSVQVGENTLAVELLNISRHGIWVLVKGEELFLGFDLFPWFRRASVEDIANVELHGEDHLYWPDLDIDLTTEIIRYPERYPLIQQIS